MKYYQDRNGIDPEITESKRFFQKTGFGKTECPTGWNTPENWVFMDDIPDGKPFGYVACGSGSTIAVIDYDHCIDDSGMMYKPAYSLYRKIEELGGTYTEISLSGHGLHQIIDLGDLAGSFAPISNDTKSIIIWKNVEEYKNLSKEEQDKIPKIELYFNTGGKYFILTGAKYKKQHRIAHDEQAAAIWREALALKDECQKQYNSVPMPQSDGTAKFVLTDKERADVLDALQYISSDNYETWRTVGQALQNCGFSFDVFDEWSKWSDQRTGIPSDKYDGVEKTQKKWDSFNRTPSKYNRGTIFRFAKDNGWKPKSKQKYTALQPDDESDLGQAEVFNREFGAKVRYSKETGFLVYDGTVWQEDSLKAQGLSQQLTDRQLKDAKKWLNNCRLRAEAILEGRSNENPDEVKTETRKALLYYKYIISRRSSNRIAATLTEVGPKVQINIEALDKNPFLLNTPTGTVNLKTGECSPHNPKDYCTKITAVSPDNENSEVFKEFLERMTCGDKDLQRYLQEVIGGCAVGAVKREELIIATGEGGNGKSTLFNTIAKCLGSYASTLAPETLTADNRKNKSPEFAELRGKRFVIAAELEEGCRLDTGAMKKLCSIDKIHCEPKYKQPYDFVPSHHLIMYTNHLPKVGSNDSGTWDRLAVLPFNARIRGSSTEIKDYSSILFETCGGAILAWVIEGAKRIIENGFHVKQPECVVAMTQEYRMNNDWLQNFLQDRCKINPLYQVGGGDLYAAYREFCSTVNDFTRSAAEFSQAVISAGYEAKKTSHGRIYKGLSLKSYEERQREERQALKQA